MRARVIPVFALLLLMASHGADAKDAPWVCDSAPDNASLLQCADAEFRKHDAELNRLYNVLLARAAEFNDLQAAYGPPPVAALRDAQRAWVAFRDANCHWKATAFYGGTGQAVVFAGCRVQMTRDRVSEFKVAMEP